MNRENNVNSFIATSGLTMVARTFKLTCALAFAAVLAACSGGGAPTVVNPVTSAPPVADYTGPAPQNADVQAFKLNLWENVKASNRCGGCHNANGQTPQFARNDDVNAAYQAANTVVNLAQPDQSRMVLKVAGGHNCWLASASACGDTLTVWIRNWAGSSASGGKQIELQAPTIKEVGSSKTFPATSAQFQASLLWNDPANSPGLLRKYCSRCHAPTAAIPVQPFFASSDPDEAYAAVRSKINLDNPAMSRLVIRLRTEFHNCWSDCAANSNTMEAAVKSFTDQIQLTQIDPSLITSKALTLYDGTVAAGGNRFDTNVIALYEFKTGTGNVAYDTSGVEPALNLTLSGTDMWVGGWGINIKAGQKAQGSTTASKKLSDQIKSSGEFSIEAWMAPADVVQEDAYAVSYSAGIAARNVTLAQKAYQYEAMTRTSETDANGMPTLLTNDKDRDAQASLQHVVLTYDPVNGRRLYVNGQFTGDVDPKGGGGSLSDWDDSFALVLGNETSSNRQWKGVMRLVAIHNRALTLEQIQQNFAAGVGERYFLLFNVESLVDVPKAYLMFEGSQYDSYSYLFNKPTFISLDPNATVPSIDLAGIRIGVNGAEARVGQTYVPFSATIGGSNYTKGTGQLLSNTGAVVALDKGPVADEFFLTFEKIGTHTHVVTEAPVTASTPSDSPDSPQAGLRTFDAINATFSKLTGVPVTSPTVVATFANVKQQLPSVPSIDAFLASHQTGIAQLAIAYCSAMVDSDSLRQAFLAPGADISPNQAGSVFGGAGNQANRDRVINSLGTKLVGDLTSQPTQTEIYDEINTLLQTIASGTSGTNPKGSGVAMKGACAAVLGSAATTVQ
ncbi:MAG: LamG domain-containing protein [Gammaproteobacteria bacterium]